MSTKNISVEDKIYAINLYLNGKENQHRIASIFDNNGFVIMNLWAQTRLH